MAKVENISVTVSVLDVVAFKDVIKNLADWVEWVDETGMSEQEANLYNSALILSDHGPTHFSE